MAATRQWTTTQAARLLKQPLHRVIYLFQDKVVGPPVREPRGRGSSRPRVEVEIGRPGGAKTRATAMVATGSEASFVRTEVADRLGLRRRAGRKWRIRGDAGTTRIEIAEACIAWCARQALHRSRRKPRR